MVTLIKNIAKMYQGQSINGNRKTLSNLEDLKAFDINFYQEVEKHKARRLRQRMNFVSHTQALIMDSPKERV